MATKYGTNGDDILTGTKAADALYGRGGGDVLFGFAGDDRLFGRGGDDTFYGGYGDDVIKGGAGVDKLDYSGIISLAPGGSSGISVAMFAERVVYTSVAGNDTFDNIENIDGTQVWDAIQGNRYANVLAGMGGDDFINGNGGDDRVYGGAGNDWIGGDSGNDSVYGAAGDDRLDDGAGNDRLVGGAGDDWLRGREDDDTLVGGTERDTFVDVSDYGSGDTGRDVIVDFVHGQDSIDFYTYNGGPEIRGFSGLDTNGNGVLDNGDAYVGIGKVTFEGVAKTSTTIDVTDFGGGVPDSLVVFGVTGLTGDDFS